MADDWEDWEDESYTPALPAVQPPKPPAVKNVALAEGVDLSKFEDEDAEPAEVKKHDVPAPQPKKKEEKKYLKGEVVVEEPLDDPVLEKLRQQRLIEQADLASAQELFGGEGGTNQLDMFLPKSLKDFEEFAQSIVNRYVLPHKDSKNYKGFLKALIKTACGPLSSTETKDVETSVAGVRTEKFKAEQAEAAAKKGIRKNVNMGKMSDVSAGLEDYQYAGAAAEDDEYDFM